MARYTETLAEFLKDGGTLPALFDTVTINGEKLTDIFTAHFAAREIGFETPALFEMRLIAKAAILIPDLKAGLNAYSGALSALNDPQTVHTKTGGIRREYGTRKRNTWDQPTATSNQEVDLTDVGAQNITIDYGGEDSETYNQVKDVDSVKGVNEGIQILQALSQEAQNYLEAWLSKFEPLFMQIY